MARLAGRAERAADEVLAERSRLGSAADLPAGDPSYVACRESAQGFLNPANQTTTTDTYAITREPGS
jgi:hypothetical protein